MAAAAPTAPSKRRAWLLAVRPPTLPAAVSPVLAGTGIAAVDGDFEVGRFFLAMIGAIFIQIVVNFANDLSDFRRGADTPERLGPPRAVAQGWLSQREMTIGITLATAAALIVGVVLILIVGWPILIIGGASLIAAVTYTGGPLPYGYRGLGDIICFLFFGFVAVMGAGYVQIEELTWELAAASVPVGCLVTAILVVNNLRDIDTDRASDKRTLAVLDRRTQHAHRVRGPDARRIRQYRRLRRGRGAALLLLPRLDRFAAGYLARPRNHQRTFRRGAESDAEADGATAPAGWRVDRSGRRARDALAQDCDQHTSRASI